MINASHLTKEFGPIKAVSDLTFSVNKGEILGFLGPNGAGKTTTMRILAGIFPPTRGSVMIAGFDVLENSMEIRKRIGYLPEQFPIYPELTVTEYLAMVASIWDFDRKKRDEQVKDVLEKCGLRSEQNSLLRRLSRGYRQRVGLAQALVHDPEVLILDEPTVGLDPKQIREIRELIKSFQGQKTVILSTHILPEVSMTCQRVLIINQGKVVAEGTPESLTRQIESGAHVQIQAQGPPEDIVRTLSAVPGVLEIKMVKSSDGREGTFLIQTKESVDVRPQIAQAIVENHWGLLTMQLQYLSLEDIFVKLVTKEESE